MKSLPLIIFVLLTACGPHEPKLAIQGFEPYVEYFEQMSYYTKRPTRVHDLIVEFGDVKQFGKDVVGETFTQANTTPKIWLDEDYWDHSDECGRLAVLMHEMGHAIFDYDHRDNVKSIMNTYVVHDYCKEEDYYVFEFFRFGLPDYNPIQIENLTETSSGLKW